MHCPQGDGELRVHHVHKQTDLPVSYSSCQHCGGYWLSSYEANYLPAASISHSSAPDIINTQALTCPVCTTSLTRLQTDAIPAGTRAWQCSQGHGYFFPAGDLYTFRKAQEARITYHKLWNIPLPHLSTVMLATLALFLASTGIITLVQIQKAQTTQSQARELFGKPIMFVAPNRSVLVSVVTTQPTIVTFHIDTLNIEKNFTTSDRRTHSLLLPDLPKGTFTYYLTAQIGERLVRSDMLTLTIP